jgi:hypothetical protein
MKSVDASIAIYWDFENLHAALFDAKNGPGAYSGRKSYAQRFRTQKFVDVRAVLRFAATKGRVTINRAYGNWAMLNVYQHDLLAGSVDLVQLFPPGSSAKNGADIRLCLDALEDCGARPRLSTIIIVGGDSDYMPLAHKLKGAERWLVGIGARGSTNRHWAGICDEFRYYEDLIGQAIESPSVNVHHTVRDAGLAEASAAAESTPFANGSDGDALLAASVEPRVLGSDKPIETAAAEARTPVEVGVHGMHPNSEVRGPTAEADAGAFTDSLQVADALTDSLPESNLAPEPVVDEANRSLAGLSENPVERRPLKRVRKPASEINEAVRLGLARTSHVSVLRKRKLVKRADANDSLASVRLIEPDSPEAGSEPAAPPACSSGASDVSSGIASEHPGEGKLEAKSDAGEEAPSLWAGRNAPCPCGSGFRYKECHGRLT